MTVYVILGDQGEGFSEPLAVLSSPEEAGRWCALRKDAWADYITFPVEVQDKATEPPIKPSWEDEKFGLFYPAEIGRRIPPLDILYPQFYLMDLMAQVNASKNRANAAELPFSWHVQERPKTKWQVIKSWFK